MTRQYDVSARGSGRARLAQRDPSRGL